MQNLFLYSVTFFGVLVVASSFEIFSVELEPLAIEVSKFKCLEEGRFPHPHNCGGYIECVRRKEGNFKRRFGSCHGAKFSSERKFCMVDVQNNECERSSRLPRALATDRRFSSLCSLVRNGFVCADCKTAVNCVDGVAYTETCGAGDLCAEKQGFGGAVCYPSEPAECACHTSNEFQVDLYNHQMFFFCDAPGADPDLYHCPEDMLFDLTSNQCSNVHGLPVCTETGIFSDKSSCSQYYTCIYSKDGWVQKSFSCVNETNTNLMYNEDTGRCEDPCSWDTGEFTCQAEGRFPDRLSCQHYYECILEEGGFRQHHRECPDGYQWDVNAFGEFGHCLAGNDHCTPLKVSKCIIPEGQCSDGGQTNEGESEPFVDPFEDPNAGESEPFVDPLGDYDAPEDNGLPDGAPNLAVRSELYSALPAVPADLDVNDPTNAQIRLWNILNRGSRRARSKIHSN